MNFLTAAEINQFAHKGYLVKDHWLNPRDLEKVHHDFSLLLETKKFKKAQIQNPASAEKLVRGDWTYWLGEDSPASLRNLQKVMESWISFFNANFYCGLTNLECHLACYPPGPGYEKHWDQPTGQKNRQITFVLYLNQDWPVQAGGELLLYSASTGACLEKISPLGGRLVIFRSDLFPHEVAPAREARRSLTGWFRNDAL